EERILARREAPFALVGAARIVEGLVLLVAGEVLEMPHHGRVLVEGEHRVEAVEPVRFGGELDVVPGGELLDIGPGEPGGRAAALVVARGVQVGGSREGVRPGGRDLVDAGLLEASRLTHITSVDELNGKDSISPLAVE